MGRGGDVEAGAVVVGAGAPAVVGAGDGVVVGGGSGGVDMAARSGGGARGWGCGRRRRSRPGAWAPAALTAGGRAGPRAALRAGAVGCAGVGQSAQGTGGARCREQGRRRSGPRP